MNIFNIYGLLIMIVIMIPNILFAILHKNEFNNKYNKKIIEFFEQIGRYLSLVFMIINLPVVTLGYWFNNAEFSYILINSILCFLYCLFWIIYRNKNGLIRPLLLSITPSIIFIFSGILLLNIPLIISSILFSVSHVMISCKNLK